MVAAEKILFVFTGAGMVGILTGEQKPDTKRPPDAGGIGSVIRAVGARLALKYAYEIFVDADLVCIYCEPFSALANPWTRVETPIHRFQ